MVTRSSHIVYLKFNTLVASLPGSWRDWVSVRTGWSGANTLLLFSIVSLTGNLLALQHTRWSSHIREIRCWDAGVG